MVYLEHEYHLGPKLQPDLAPEERLRVNSLHGIHDEGRRVIGFQVRYHGADLVCRKILGFVHYNHIVTLAGHRGSFQSDVVPVDYATLPLLPFVRCDHLGEESGPCRSDDSRRPAATVSWDPQVTIPLRRLESPQNVLDLVGKVIEVGSETGVAQQIWYQLLPDNLPWLTQIPSPARKCLHRQMDVLRSTHLLGCKLFNIPSKCPIERQDQNANRSR